MPHEKDAATNRRRHTAGEATRELLMVSAERLFAWHGVEGVTLREIQIQAGQSNSSVIAYHFGSKAGLVRALIDFRYRTIDARRTELLEAARADNSLGDPRTAVWLIVRPLVESIERGEMFVPFLAKLNENPLSHGEYWPRQFENDTVDVSSQIPLDVLADMPERVSRGREVQLYNSVLHMLSDHARRQHRISEARLSSYVDGWVGMLTAPVSASTSDLLKTDASAHSTPAATVESTDDRLVP
ncbi:TetR/AcrR family transcriptional regulator [Rhodococcus sp. CX]|uniref:TetR/AcrR family transcriptional regulator n=1 Tax=Rhodococcus sp. CX TaxID=2789880 RepID=UPI0018CD26EF|nr:TetR family transcriptional regulator [Rhodococcus sp. CX]MBH0118402.1 TetR/AcrR family transcriptional regulator [Rhodococcus sp. CX]